MFAEGKSSTVFFPSDTLIHDISRDGSKNYNIRTCEHMILGQLRMGARQTNYALLHVTIIIVVIIINVKKVRANVVRLIQCKQAQDEALESRRRQSTR